MTLRGLEINGGPPNLPGVNGVRYLQAARLNIEDSTIYNFLGAAPNGFGVIVNNTSLQAVAAHPQHRDPQQRHGSIGRRHPDHPDRHRDRPRHAR